MSATVTVATPEVLATGLPGVVLWRYPARVFTVAGVKRRSRYYSVTHEPSGIALLSGTEGPKVTLRRVDADDIVAKMGDIRWRGKPIDWTQPFETLKANDRVRVSLLVLAGWRLVLDHYDKATKEWAARNNIELDWPSARRERSTDG